MLEATNWIRSNTEPNDVILFRPNHRSDMVDYPFNAVPAYYAKRPVFIWTSNTAPAYRRAALEQAKYAVVTVPQPPSRGLLAILNRFRHSSRVPESTDFLEAAGFRPLLREQDFIIYIR